MSVKATERRNTLDGLSAKQQAALQEEVSLVDKVRQLETDKAALEERVTQLAEEEAAYGGAKLEESKREVSLLRQALEEHEAAANQVGCNAKEGLHVSYLLVCTGTHQFTISHSCKYR